MQLYYLHVCNKYKNNKDTYLITYYLLLDLNDMLSYFVLIYLIRYTKKDFQNEKDSKNTYYNKQKINANSNSIIEFA